MPGTINLGDIVFGLGPDTSRLRTALRDILDFGDAVEQAAASAKNGADATSQAFIKQEQAIVRAITQMQNFNQTLRNAGDSSSGGLAQIIRNNQNAFKDFSAQMTSGVLTPLQYSRAMEQFTTSMSRSQRAFKDWKLTADEGQQGGGRFIGMLQNLATAASLVTGPLGGVAFRLTLLSHLMEQNRLSAALAVGGLALFGQAALKLTEGALETEKGIERMRLQLFALSGNAQETALDMKFVLNVADQFGAPFEDIAQHFAKLELASRGTRLEGGKMRDMFIDIIAYGTRFGVTEQNLDQILNNVTRSVTRQRMTIQDLRGITNIIPGADQIVSEMFGSRGNFDLMLKRGQVLSDTFWRNFWQQALKDYGIDPTQRINNIFSATGRFKNAQLELNNAFNQAIGLTDGYSTNLERLTDLLHLVSTNMTEILRIAGTVGGVLLGGLLGSLVVSRFLVLIDLIKTVGTALSTVGLFAAIATAPLTTIGALIAAVGAGVGSWYLLNQVISDNKDKVLGSVPPLEEYLKTLDKSKQSVSTHTAMLIEDSKARLQNAQAALAQAEATLAANQSNGIGEVSKDGAETTAKSFWDYVKEYIVDFGLKATDDLGNSIANTMQAAAQKAAGQATALRDTIAKLQADIARGQKVLQDQISNEGKNSPSLDKTAAQLRLETVQREFQELLDESNKTFNAMQQGPKALADALEEVQLDKTLEQWRKKFLELQLPTDEINQKMATLEVTLRRLADAKRFDKEFMSLGQTLDFAFNQLGSSAIDKFANALVNGQLKTLKAKDLIVDALQAIIKKVMELAVLNPILNSLFGSDRQSLSLQSGGTGTGGIIGNLLHSFGLGGASASAAAPGFTIPFGGIQVPTFHTGGIVGQTGGTGRSVPLSLFDRAPRLHSGLSPDEYPAILQSGERVTPRGQMSSQQAPQVHINVINNTGEQTTTSKKSQGGTDMYEIVIGAVNKGIIDKRFNKSLGSQFNMQPRSLQR